MSTRDTAPSSATSQDSALEQQQANAPHTDAEMELRVVPMPADVNANGDIFGGWIMSQIDIAGALPAVRLSQGRVATVAVNGMTFKQPVQIGDVVSFYTRILRVGRTSITVEVDVWSDRYRANQRVHVTHATLTYVAIGSDGRPRLVQPQDSVA